MAQITETAKPVKSAFDPAESAAKLALDTAELVELVPELQREACAVNRDDSGGLVLVLPRHPKVLAFIYELDAMEYETTDLKTARRRFRVARDAYQFRVVYRLMPNLTGPAAFKRLVSLSGILIARAAACGFQVRRFIFHRVKFID